MEFTPLTSEHVDVWAALLATCFGREAADMVALLRHFEPGRRLLAWGAWDGGRLAAQYSCLLTEIRVAEAAPPVLAGMSINMAVHPDYRRRGLVKRLAAPVYDAVRWRGGVAGVGFSNAAGVKVDRHSSGYGYRVVGQMEPLLALLRRPAAGPLSLTDTWPEGTWTPWPSRPVRFCATPAWLRRRFARHPFRRYRFGVWRQNGRLHGVVVYRPVRLAGALPGVALLAAHGVALPELMRRWSRAMCARGYRLAHLLSSPHSDVKQALRQTAVCLPLPYTRTPYYLTAKPLGADTPPSLFDFSQWHCAGGDIL